MTTVRDCWWCTGSRITWGKAIISRNATADGAQPYTLRFIPSPKKKQIDYAHEVNNVIVFMDLIFIHS